MTENSTAEGPALTFSTANGTTTIGATTRRAILSIRPRATTGPSSKVNRVPIELNGFLLDVVTNNCYFELVHNPTFTGTPVWANVDTTNSAVERSVHGDAAAGAFTGGMVIFSGYAASGTGAAHQVTVGEHVSKLPITLDMNGSNPIALSLVITSMSGTSTVAGALNWRELT
jgi:hypothetical protein